MDLHSVFSTVINMSMTGSIVIGFVLLARLLLKRAPKVFSYALWAVVLFRLLCPFSVSSALSLLRVTGASVSESQSVVTSVQFIPVLDIYQYAPHSDFVEDSKTDYYINDNSIHTNSSIPDNRTEFTPTPDAGSQQATAEPVREPVYYAAYIWLLGIGILLAYNCVCYGKLRRKLVGAVCLRKNIYLADHIPSPFILGLVKPKIYLPSVLERSEYRYILAHERYHIRRKDHIVKLLAYGALCLHWFNPLVWVAFALSGKDMEMSCDEAVIRRYGPNVRAEYSASLLRLATNKRIIAATPLAFGEGDTKGRVLNMAKWKKPKFWVLLCAAVLCVAILVACAVNPAQNTDTKKEIDETIPTSTEPIAEETMPFLSVTDPEEACRTAMEVLKKAESYYICNTYESKSFEGTGRVEYRRHGNDLLVNYVSGPISGSSIYFDGVYGIFYGDYWVMDEVKSDIDPNEWLTRWSMDGKEISNLQIVDEYTLTFDAVWPHQMDETQEYHGKFTYNFAADGSLSAICREYYLLGGEAASETTTEWINVMAETPRDTYAAIKEIADESITHAELETYRSYKDIVTEVPSNSTMYDTDYALGSGQMGWKFLQEAWYFKLGAENATPTSVTLVHSESDSDHKSLIAEEGFWLEVLENGVWRYVDNDLKTVASPEVNIDVSWTGRDSYTLNWSDSYGALKPGYYRVGRNYTVTMNSGETDTQVCYTKFRVYQEDQDKLLTFCQNALDALLNRDSYHLSVTQWWDTYALNTAVNLDHTTEDIWKNGEDYLSVTRAFDANGKEELESHSGSMLKGGRSYALKWAGEPVKSDLASWSRNTFMDETHFTLWTFYAKWYDSGVEEVIADGNAYRIIQKYDFDDQYECSETVLTFDESGNLKEIRKAYLPSRGCSESEKVVELHAVVLRTTPTEITQTIDSQNVSAPLAFSFEEDVEKYSNAVTEGFVNTSASPVRTMDDAVALADKECTLPENEVLQGGRYNITQVFYDASTGIWKVVFAFSQDFDCQIIYLDSQGITQMTVITRQ